MPAADGRDGPAAVAVETRMFRALAVLRIVVLANTVGWTVYRDTFDRVALGWACVAVMVVWTGASIVLYAAPVRRTPLVLGTDLALAVLMLLASPVVKGEGFQASVPGFWINGALLAWAIRWGWRGGLAAGIVLGGTDLLVRAGPEAHHYGQVFLILLAGTIVGYLGESLQQMAAERDAAQRRAAAAEERARLARAVHDGVLQVLALVQRRGAELGGAGPELARLAGEQEERLRALIRSQGAAGAVTAAADRAGHAGRRRGRDSEGASRDLASVLGALAAARRAEVALPGTPVLMGEERVAEIAAAVGACLDNVTRHVGEDAAAWILLEDLGDRVVVSVRDEGPGIAPARLAQAEAEGRLGVTGSIRGRIADLGGHARLDTGPQGTEWELEVPR